MVGEDLVGRSQKLPESEAPSLNLEHETQRLNSPLAEVFKL